MINILHVLVLLMVVYRYMLLSMNMLCAQYVYTVYMSCCVVLEMTDKTMQMTQEPKAQN